MTIHKRNLARWTKEMNERHPGYTVVDVPNGKRKLAYLAGDLVGDIGPAHIRIAAVGGALKPFEPGQGVDAIEQLIGDLLLNDSGLFQRQAKEQAATGEAPCGCPVCSISRLLGLTEDEPEKADESADATEGAAQGSEPEFAISPETMREIVYVGANKRIWNQPAYGQLLAAGFVTRPAAVIDNVDLTPKGEAYLKALYAVPLPVAKPGPVAWEVPASK